MKNIKAVMVDYDGTITGKGVFELSEEIIDIFGTLLAKDFPICVCTGRQLDSFLRRFEPVKKQIENKYGRDVLKNLYFAGENGAIGYKFHPSENKLEDKFEIFYQATWPSEIDKDDFKRALDEAVSGKVEYLEHIVPIVMRPKGGLTMPVDLVYEKSAELFEILTKFVDEYPRAKEFLHLGNSGLGCLICPHDGDKDSAILRFHKYFGFSGDDDRCREIVVIGDNPQIGGNDYYFLNGRYGTAFTVGEDPPPSATSPSVVVDKNGKRLFHDEGTLYLLHEILESLK